MGDQVMKNCKHCKRKVSPVYKRNPFNWGLFFLFLITGIGDFIYVPYWILFGRKKRCPICNARV